MSAARRFTISGRVQGVFFRDSTRKVAESLGLTGYARNLPDGDVEVLACGDAAKIEELEAWLHEGPPLSRVTEVRSYPAAAEAHTRFTIG
ncbi:MAG: acylphosphatase [Woeseiaceae bacterium]|nr:acylphosphatase [Woeseiaceae bacterium]